MEPVLKVTTESADFNQMWFLDWCRAHGQDLGFTLEYNKDNKTYTVWPPYEGE